MSTATHTPSEEPAKCPVDHTALKHLLPEPPAAPHPIPDGAQPSEYPVDCNTNKHLLPNSPAPVPATATSCDSEAMNPTKNMPRVSQNSPSPGQRIPLSTGRVVSSIPKAGDTTEQVWIYPSEQMFFNAMRRKNWDPQERDMSIIVPIHNAVNEQAWRKILQFEALHTTSCNRPKLLKFQGRPKDITPKARIYSWLGYTLPFDRHDWVIDRCGKRVTYVIDFYSGKPDPRSPEKPSFFLDVRPAANSISGVWDRIRMTWERRQWM
ncbi:cytochrome c/c1 heme-lyase [Jimgerdemannia flammicorona]|uniref:Holocytochrome c-type synthase n=1 Tax=Jimgerdemannia flammicorona TaxID=994334 RepID=A0A433PJH4_9FUNG|nr:cytochrome c/c1 heme-lyase [Jimgerdemannia flammicorona]